VGVHGKKAGQDLTSFPDDEQILALWLADARQCIDQPPSTAIVAPVM
jgi:hypothetical protein